MVATSFLRFSVGCLSHTSVSGNLRTLNESINFNISQTLLNAKNKKSYFVSGTAGRFKISYIGEDHVDKDLIEKG